MSIECRRCVEMSGLRLISAFGLALIFSQISVILSADIVPVVLFDHKTQASLKSVDALRIMSKSEFSDVVSEIVGGSQRPCVVFTKDDLCVEELSQEKLKLKKLNLRYFPSVESPLSVFENLDYYNVTKEDKPETIADGQVIIVRIENLSTIDEVYADLLKKNSKVIGVIAGASCSYSRSERTRRAIRADNTTADLIVQADRILLYSGSGIFLRADGDDFVELGEPRTVASVSNASDAVRLDLTFAPNNASEITLRLNFAATASKYWYFSSVEYETASAVMTLTRNSSLHFPFNFSYHCAQNTLFYLNSTAYLNITNLQVQLDPSQATDNSTAVFNDGWDCVGFTSIPILSGIFITAILALIMIWALTMILDIRTMDRFDDPKGKTITIAVSE